MTANMNRIMVVKIPFISCSWAIFRRIRGKCVGRKLFRLKVGVMKIKVTLIVKMMIEMIIVNVARYLLKLIKLFVICFSRWWIKKEFELFVFIINL